MKNDIKITQREFNWILNKAHFGECDIAINLLVDIVKRQQKQIEILQKEIIKGDCNE